MSAGIGNLIEALAVMTSKVLDKLPNYDQKKKDEFYELMTAYKAEKAKPVSQRDDDLILNLRDQISTFSIAFSKEIGQ